MLKVKIPFGKEKNFSLNLEVHYSITQAVIRNQKEKMVSQWGN